MRILLILATIFVVSCNPVKQVLKDRQKFEEVAKEVVKAGYCINDTVVVESTKDSVVYKDKIITTRFPFILPCAPIDTTFPDGTKIKYANGELSYEATTKEKVEIRYITKTNNIRDTKLEGILKGEISARDVAINGWVDKYNEKKAEVEEGEQQLKDQRSKFRKDKLNLWLIITALIIFILRKHIWRLVKKIKLPWV